MFPTGLFSVSTGCHQSLVMCMYILCVGGWVGVDMWVCICTSFYRELSPYPIDGSHMITHYKAASPLK